MQFNLGNFLVWLSQLLKLMEIHFYKLCFCPKIFIFVPDRDIMESEGNEYNEKEKCLKFN